MHLLVSIIAAMTDPLTALPALLIGTFVRPPYLHFALPAWGVTVVVMVAGLASGQQLTMTSRAVAALFIAPIIVGYMAAGLAWLVRRHRRLHG